MQTSFINHLLLFMLSLSSYPASSQAKQSNLFSLTVKAEGLRNATGVVQFALYNLDGTIPDEHYKKYLRLEKVAISDDRAVATFFDLPAGRYAVNILHDENENGKIDKGLIKPKEGIGFSNYSSIGFTNRPNFKKASFGLKQDTTIKVKVIYL